MCALRTGHQSDSESESSWQRNWVALADLEPGQPAGGPGQQRCQWQWLPEGQGPERPCLWPTSSSPAARLVTVQLCSWSLPVPLVTANRARQLCWLAITSDRWQSLVTASISARGRVTAQARAGKAAAVDPAEGKAARADALRAHTHTLTHFAGACAAWWRQNVQVLLPCMRAHIHCVCWR